MKKIIAISFTALALAGCVGEFGSRVAAVKETIAAVSNFTVTQGQVDTARTAYNGAVLAPLRRYALLPRCKTGQTISINVPCHDRLMLVKLRDADKVVEKGFKETQRKIDTGDNSGASLAYDTLMIAIDTAKALIAKTGVEVL